MCFIHDGFSEIRMRNWKKWQGEAQTVLEISWKNRWGFETFILCDVISVCWVHYGGDSLVAWVQGSETETREVGCILVESFEFSLLNSLRDSCFNFS